MVRVTVWNEFRHERNPESEAARLYPDGMHETIADALRQAGLEVRTATLDEPEHGLTEASLDATDVLFWWGHKHHAAVEDPVAERVRRRVLAGMGLVALHSAHFSKPFVGLMGTSCGLKWRVRGERERLWVVNPGHPIASGLPEHITLDREEMYGEPFDVPEPDELVLVSWFQGGEVFRSGCCWRRGLGRIFYFRPGHETFPSYHDPLVRRVLVNAARWAAPVPGARPIAIERREPLEPLE